LGEEGLGEGGFAEGGLFFEELGFGFDVGALFGFAAEAEAALEGGFGLGGGGGVGEGHFHVVFFRVGHFEGVSDCVAVFVLCCFVVFWCVVMLC
jgi:hypothetical protein